MIYLIVVQTFDTRALLNFTVGYCFNELHPTTIVTYD